MSIKLTIGTILRCLSFLWLAFGGLCVLLILYGIGHEPNAFDRPLASVSLNELGNSFGKSLLIMAAMCLDLWIIFCCIRKAFRYNEEAAQAWWEHKPIVIALYAAAVILIKEAAK